MSYGKVWNSDKSRIGGVVPNRLIDIQIPDDVMQQLYLSIDSKVFISDGGNMTAKLKLDNSEGGRELQLGFRVDGETPINGWWESNNKLVERTIKDVPNDVLNYLVFYGCHHKMGDLTTLQYFFLRYYSLNKLTSKLYL